MPPNPYVLLGLLVGLLATAFGGYQYGYSRAEDAVSARVAAAQVEAIATANRDVQVATARAVEQAKREADARVRAAGVRRKGEIDAIAKARPECSRDGDSYRLLVDAVDLANGNTSATPLVSDPLPATANPSQR